MIPFLKVILLVLLFLSLVGTGLMVTMSFRWAVQEKVSWMVWLLISLAVVSVGLFFYSIFWIILPVTF